ncbi:MAG: hypothetical protein GY870_06130 [archaeon]|nr:hypothetical protein [archaeon]
MIKSLLICDSNGYPFYSKVIDEAVNNIEPTLLSGLISAIGTLGKQLFSEEIATITFGEGKNLYHIITVTKELLFESKVIYFVFITKGELNMSNIRGLVTNIFIETKQVLKDPSGIKDNIKDKVDNIIDFKFKGLIDT